MKIVNTESKGGAIIEKQKSLLFNTGEENTCLPAIDIIKNIRDKRTLSTAKFKITKPE